MFVPETLRRALILGLFFSLLAAGCSRGIQLTLTQQGAGTPGAPNTTAVSAGSSAGGGVVTTANLIVFVRTSPMSFPPVKGDTVMTADPFLETGIQEVLSRVER